MRSRATHASVPARAAFALAIAASSAALASPAAAAGGTLEAIRARGTLLWGADQEGGGPFVYPRDDRPEEVTGFEVELAARLAEYLKVEPVFVQGAWDKLPDMLASSKLDIILNGYEWDRTRVEIMGATLPYYVYGLQLLARQDDASLASWDDLGRPGPAGARRKVGVLTGSAADRYLRSRFGAAVDVISYDGNTDSMREVETGKLDATLEDTPIAVFYASRFPGLKPVGEPAGKGYYTIFARKPDSDLVTALNEAIILMLRSGELERLYRRYGIWDAGQSELLSIAENGRFFGYAAAVAIGGEAQPAADGDSPLALASEDEVHAGVRKRGFRVVEDYGVIMIKSAGMTVILSALSFPIAILIGLFIALARTNGPRALALPLGLYVELIRGTPIMLQLYFVFFLLPELGVTLPAFWTAIVGLAVNYSAYESEIYRAGLQAIPTGQMEAALALGMSRALALRRIIVPQALRIVIPPVMNDFIALFKDTSVCSVITIVELTKRFSVLSQSTQATVELMIMTAVLYLLMSYPMSLLSRRIEKRLEWAGAR